MASEMEMDAPMGAPVGGDPGTAWLGPQPEPPGDAPSQVAGNRTNLIVNYLPQTLTDEEFLALFSAVGEVASSNIVRDHATNYSHGYGFVQFVTPEDAQKAIWQLNGTPLQHKIIKVALARPPGSTSQNCNLYIVGIPPSMTSEMLKEFFAPYGEIVHAKVLLKADMTAKGDGFVLYERSECAEHAMNELNGQTLPGGTRPLIIKYAMENKRGGQQQGGVGGKYPPPPPPAGRGRGGFGGPMRNRGGQQQNRFNPMQQRGGRGGGGGGFGRGGGRGNWRGGQNNGAGNGFGAGDEFYGGNQSYDQGFGAGGGYDESYGGGAYDGGLGGNGSFGDQGYGDQSGMGGFDQGYDQGGFGGEFGADQGAGQGFQEYPENGYQGYYDAIGFQGYQMPGQQNRGRGRGARGGGGGGPRGAPRGVGAPRGAPRGGGGPRGGARGGRGGTTYASAPGGNSVALYVYNIGPNASEDDVMTIFSHYGSVVKVDVIMDYEKNVTKNYGFVHMSTEEEAETAISALNERYCMRPNHPMQVRYHAAKNKKQ